LVEPRASPLTVEATISPPKRISDCTSLEALATPVAPVSLDAEAVTEPVVTTEPSAGYAKLAPDAMWSGGAETVPIDAPA
jgi:hypothetical protein